MKNLFKALSKMLVISAVVTLFFLADVKTAHAVVLMEWSDLQDIIDEAEGQCNIDLYCNVVAQENDSAIVIPAGSIVVIDLKGYSIDRGLSASSASLAEGYVIKVEDGATLYIKDTVGEGKITGGNSDGGPVGGILVEGTLFLEGGSIENNYGTDAPGVYVAESGEFIMHGGKVCNNAGTDYSLGVSVSGSFVMTGGEITGNTSTFPSFANYVANGVIVSNRGSITLGGTAKIYGNGNSQNLCLGNDVKINIGTLSEAPAAGMDIHLRGSYSGVITSNVADGFLEYFHADDSSMWEIRYT